MDSVAGEVVNETYIWKTAQRIVRLLWILIVWRQSILIITNKKPQVTATA